MHSLMAEMSEADVGDDVGGDDAHNIRGKRKIKQWKALLHITLHYVTCGIK